MTYIVKKFEEFNLPDKTLVALYLQKTKKGEVWTSDKRMAYHFPSMASAKRKVNHISESFVEKV